MSRVRILLADRYAPLLHQATKVLEKNYDVVAAVKDELTVVSECIRLKPDIVVLDICMGRNSGIDLAQQLRESRCRSKIIFLTIYEDREFVDAAIGAGALAYVKKSRLNTDLTAAVEAVLADRFFLSPQLVP
jgi:DNA-binding NarL/FixJ family response regulator